MTDIIIIAVIVVILAAAIGYVIKAKKSGAKCIGCPSAKQCSSHKCGCGCHNDNNDK